MLPIKSKQYFIEAIELHEHYLKERQINFRTPAIEHSLTLVEVTISDLDLHQRDLSDAHFARSRIKNLACYQCNFSGAFFYGCTFENCEFIECNFYIAEIKDYVVGLGINFQKSSFLKAEIFRTDLRYCNFSNCDFTGGYLNDTDLRFANFTDVKLESTQISSSKIYNHQRFTPAHLRRVLVNDVGVDMWGTKKLSGREGLAHLFNIPPDYEDWNIPRTES